MNLDELERPKTWSCKIGEVVPEDVPDDGDLPMREAVARAYKRITGDEPKFIFSGWGAKLTESERAVVENLEPDAAHYEAWLATRGLNPNESSREQCVRCGWVMGMPPLNCQNDDTPHVFPPQVARLRLLEDVAGAARRYRKIALADPTSLDRPTAGADLDEALRRLDAEAPR